MKNIAAQEQCRHDAGSGAAGKHAYQNYHGREGSGIHPGAGHIGQDILQAGKGNQRAPCAVHQAAEKEMQQVSGTAFFVP